jgi:hypothetical protein
MLTGLSMGMMGGHSDAGQETKPDAYVTPPEVRRGGVREHSNRRVSHNGPEILRFAQDDMDTTELRQVIDNNRPGVVQRGFQILDGFIYTMHKNVFAWHIACHGNRDLAFACAIDEKIMFLCPLGNGFAEKGFACVGDVRGGWIGSG